MLRPDDEEQLDQLDLPYEVVSEGGMICVVIENWRLPPGYVPGTADLLLRLAPGFPDVPPDMWWFDPPVRLADGSFPIAAELIEQYLGRSWQRFSRHFTAGQWKPGQDSLASYLALIYQDLKRTAGSAAA